MDGEGRVREGEAVHGSRQQTAFCTWFQGCKERWGRDPGPCAMVRQVGKHLGCVQGVGGVVADGAHVSLNAIISTTVVQRGRAAAGARRAVHAGNVGRYTPS